MPTDKPGTPIDAVITWVDGSDVNHQRKKRRVLEDPQGAIARKRDFESGRSDTLFIDHDITGQHDTTGQDDAAERDIAAGRDIATGRDPTRFRDNGELHYCIRSIRAFAPWIRMIFVITDQQTPEFLTPGSREQLGVRIVDHKEVFRGHEWALPTFNSRTIETVLWRIKGLAPRFIYFNDDFVLTRPVSPEDFFRDEKVILRGAWNRITGQGSGSRHFQYTFNRWATYLAGTFLGITRSMNLNLQIRSAQLAGFRHRYYRTPHVPHPLYTRLIREWFEQNPEKLEENIAFRFRNSLQFNAVYLGHHLALLNGRAIPVSAADLVMLNGEMDPGFIFSHKLKKIRRQQARFACLHALERFNPRRRKQIDQTIQSLLTADKQK